MTQCQLDRMKWLNKILIANKKFDQITLGAIPRVTGSIGWLLVKLGGYGTIVLITFQSIMQKYNDLWKIMYFYNRLGCFPKQSAFQKKVEKISGFLGGWIFYTSYYIKSSE